MKKLTNRGFTIIELMIATAVLSTILLLVTVLMINIGNLYYKGVNQSRIQDNVRDISDEIAQQIQLGDNVLTADGDAADHNAGQHAVCVGLVRYTYVLGIQIGSRAPGDLTGPIYNHVLWRDKNPNSGGCSIIGASEVNLTNAGDPSTGLSGVELVAPKSRLGAFSVTGTTSPYSLSVGEAYGDNDLLCAPSVANSCTDNNAMPVLADYVNGDLKCKDNTGQQFCATSTLNTSVIRRLK